MTNINSPITLEQLAGIVQVPSRVNANGHAIFLPTLLYVLSYYCTRHVLVAEDPQSNRDSAAATASIFLSLLTWERLN